MKIELWQIGKTAFPYLEVGIKLYQKRLKHYGSFELVTIPDVKNAKNLSTDQLKAKEREEVLKRLQNGYYLVLLDERGKTLTSMQFAGALEKWQIQSPKKLILLIGGAYGVDQQIRDRANFTFSLSSLTFSHQMVRLFVIEQLYRAFTILRNEPYHHE